MTVGRPVGTRRPLAVELAAHDEEVERILAETCSPTEHPFSTLIEQGQRAARVWLGLPGRGVVAAGRRPGLR